MAATVRRADAARNRALILDAARAMLADHDAEVSMAAVARRAEVGMATLYRNFAGRRELLEAANAAELDALVEAAAASADDPGAALADWLLRFVVFHEQKHPIAVELLRETDRGDPLFGAGRDRVLSAGRPLLARARRAGAVRDDLDLEQVLDLLLAVASIPGDDAYRAPILHAALEGLRSPR